MPVVLVSNATTRLAADLAGLGIDGLVDHVVGSALAGVAKPDPRIYHLAAELAGVPVQRCLFVDDSAGNVEAARSLGMTGLHFDGPTGCARAGRSPELGAQLVALVGQAGLVVDAGARRRAAASTSR